jgi:hypothetical protein
MNAMNATQVMDRIGLTLINAALLVGLPVAVITSLINSL